jgi:nucleoid-associated protein YgaU
MGSVAQAVLEFDEAVQVPWRPPLASAPALTVLAGGAGVARGHAARVARLAPPPQAAPSAPTRRPAAGQAARGPEAPVGRRACARCGGRAGACAPRPLRLTRRARRLLASLVAGGAVAATAWLGAVAQHDDGLRLAGDATTVVRAGDTLWSIARTVAGDGDVRVVVDDIRRLNGLEGTALVPGQVLQLP